MTDRTNDEWLHDLTQSGPAQENALADLRDYLLRVVLVYLSKNRSDLSRLSGAEIRQMAEDLAQDALLSIQDNLERFRGDARFTTWAYQFVINRAISVLRRRRRTAFSYEELWENQSAVLMDLLQEERAADPQQMVEQQRLILLLRRIIDEQLTDLQRTAVVAVYFEGRSMAETAARLEMKPNALYKLLHDARKRIKRQLQLRHFSAGDILALFAENW
jgi:RNA polymerase sigma-70 factor (ECF subfamily)